jgi:hypothetical protein
MNQNKGNTNEKGVAVSQSFVFLYRQTGGPHTICAAQTVANCCISL